MPNEQRGRLDNAIDRAVRGMMEVDPAPGLGGRVVDRLEDAPARRGLTLSFAAAAVTMALLAAVVLLQTIGPSETVQPAAPMSPAAQSAAVNPSPAGGVPTGDASSPPTPLPSPSKGTIDRVRDLPRPTVVFNGARDRVSAANARPAAAVADETPAPAMPIPETFVPISPIVIAPISIAPIVISPLTVTPLADRR
jgi:hypothetical protein